MKSTVLLTVAFLGLYGSMANGTLYRRQNNGPIVGEGEACGGFILNPPRCRKGLVCQRTNPSLPDLPGKCVKASPPVSGKGGPCGGFILNPAVCAKGLVCKYRKDIIDVPGVCVPEHKPSSPSNKY